jgi:hypothetical protein
VTYKEAAIQVLKAANRPMTTDEITDEAVRRGFIKPSGKTPVATMRMVLYATDNNNGEIKRLHQEGAARARRSSVRWCLPSK